jgi:SHS2 domain-containing protein
MSSGTPRWEHFPHGADIGIVGIGSSPEEAFEQAGRALTAVVSDPDGVRPSHSIDVQCSAPTLELLFVDWLNAIVYEMANGGRLFAKFEVHLDGEHLTGRAWGEPIDRQRHEPTIEVKGATYTELAVEYTADGMWRARCVVDV